MPAGAPKAEAERAPGCDDVSVWLVSVQVSATTDFPRATGDELVHERLVASANELRVTQPHAHASPLSISAATAQYAHGR
jgi:hypothetical protein